jgi:hypothetical protein
VRLGGNDPRVRLVDFSEGNPAVEKLKSMELLGVLFRTLLETRS